MIIEKGGGTTPKINFNVLKELSKENRQKLNLAVRKDPELWNVISGVGGLSEGSAKARIQGTITDEAKILIGAEIVISNASNDVVANITTNQHGYFSVDLEPATYSVLVKYKSEQSDKISAKILAGVTSTIDYDFEELDSAL